MVRAWVPELHQPEQVSSMHMIDRWHDACTRRVRKKVLNIKRSCASVVQQPSDAHLL